MKIEIVICEDIPIVANYLERVLLSESKEVEISIEIFHSPEKFLKYIPNHKYNLYFLDIDMPKINGIEVAKHIRKYDLAGLIIFVTSFREYMSEVFKVHTFDYILKPINKDKIHTLLKRAYPLLNTSLRNFSFSIRGRLYTVPLSKITYFEKCGRTIILHGESQKYTFYSRTQDVMAKLDESFVQIHNSFIVNIAYVRGLAGNELIVITDSSKDAKFLKLPLGRKYANSSKQKISSYITKSY